MLDIEVRSIKTIKATIALLWLLLPKKEGV